MPGHSAAARVDSAGARCDLQPWRTSLCAAGCGRPRRIRSEQRSDRGDRTRRHRFLPRRRRPVNGPTRQRCEARLRPLLHQGIVPVVTGFIGATAEGVLTTLGRGGSDYSATILGAALDADEVIIWTDVDGLMTADPRLVPDAVTIPEISYREAAELAHFGAKVLHPKTISAVTACGIPLWIRNTFSPDLPGTRITPDGSSADAGVKGLTAITEVVLITVGGPGIVGVPDVLGRTFATTAAVRANVLLITQSSSQNDICLVVASSAAQRRSKLCVASSHKIWPMKKSSTLRSTRPSRLLPWSARTCGVPAP